jgi:hypothetical protein
MESMKYYKFTNSNDNNLDNRVIRKSKSFTNKIIMVNGFNASGKTLFSPIVSSIKNVELMSFAYEIEWCSSFLYSDQMSEEAYKEFIKMHVDHSIYNQMMSRSVNFRLTDLSSAMSHKAKWTYIKRLFQKGDNAILGSIQNGKPILSLTTCHLMPFIPTLSSALQERLLFIEIVRDPMFMFHQLLILQESIIKRHPEKDFTTRVKVDGIDATYLEYYSSKDVFKDIKCSDSTSIVIGYLERMFDFYFSLDLDKLEINNSSFMLIPFEKFVLFPKQWIESIVEFSGNEWSKGIDKEMKRQKVPRKLLRAGRNLDIYKRFGWSDNKNNKNLTLVEENDNYREKMKILIGNDDVYMRLEKISNNYHKWVDNISNFTFIN